MVHGARWLRSVLAVLVALGVCAAAAGEAAYIGSKKCKKCHIKQYKSWQKTTMALVYETLKPGERAEAKTSAGLDPSKDYTTDAECLECHVTGYGKEGGFVDIATTPLLAGVGCEMCHGPGGTYVADDKMSLKNKKYKLADLLPLGLISPPTQETCEVCHNQRSPFVDESYVFDFEERKSEGTHKHIPMKYEH